MDIILINRIKESMPYDAEVNELRKYRENVRRELTAVEYINLIKQHKDDLSSILNKKLKSKMVDRLILLSFSPIELRLIYRYNWVYHRSVLSPDDIEFYVSMLEKECPTNRDIVYSSETAFKCISNYGLCIFPIMRLISIVGDNWKNIIYAKHIGDHAFYTLKDIKKDVYFWFMDCRLEEFTYDLISAILPFSLTMFSRLYIDHFGDTVLYRNLFENEFMDQDGKQLLKNIILLLDFGSLNIKLRKYFTDNIPDPGKANKFNITCDDEQQKIMFRQLPTDDDESIKTLSGLFTNPNPDDVRYIYHLVRDE